ncbi:MAG: beta-ketoacyl synthase N-terminal-like domain-containing protein [Promethearchaeota archaeon]
MAIPKVAIVGVGHSKYGKRGKVINEDIEGEKATYPAVTIRELAHESYFPALEHAGITNNEIEASVIGIAAEAFAGQGAAAALIADEVGIIGKPTMRVETACATGSTAIRTAWAQIASGQFDVMAAIGVETMTWVSTAYATELMSVAGDHRWEYPYGISFPTFYSLYAARKMAIDGLTRDQLSAVSVKSHYYGYYNKLAHLRRKVSIEDANQAVPIALPLRLYDCCLISDGAATVILANEEKAKEMSSDPLWITGLGCSSDTMRVTDRPNLTNLGGSIRAAEMAYKNSGRSPKDIDVAYVHDCFSVAEVMAYEDLGFCERGQGGKWAEERGPYIDGPGVPVNVDGGLKSKGHPLGATGIGQVVDAYKQVFGTAEKERQVPDAKVALCHNVGQHGQFVNVFILEP